MRRILRKIAENDFGALGDTSTLAEPEVVPQLDREPTESFDPGPDPVRYDIWVLLRIFDMT